MEFSIKDLFSKSADLVIFTKEILNRKLLFCAVDGVLSGPYFLVCGYFSLSSSQLNSGIFQKLLYLFVVNREYINTIY